MGFFDGRISVSKWWVGRKDQPKSNLLNFQCVLRKDAFIQRGPYSSCTATNLWLHKSESGLLNSSLCACLKFRLFLSSYCALLIYYC